MQESSSEETDESDDEMEEAAGPLLHMALTVTAEGSIVVYLTPAIQQEGGVAVGRRPGHRAGTGAMREVETDSAPPSPSSSSSSSSSESEGGEPMDYDQMRDMITKAYEKADDDDDEVCISALYGDALL